MLYCSSKSNKFVHIYYIHCIKINNNYCKVAFAARIPRDTTGDASERISKIAADLYNEVAKIDNEQTRDTFNVN